MLGCDRRGALWSPWKRWKIDSIKAVHTLAQPPCSSREVQGLFMTVNYSHFLFLPSNTWFPVQCCRDAHVTLVPNNCFRAVLRAPRREHQQVPICSPGLGWGSTSAFPGSGFIQHKGNSGSGLVFHLLDLGCDTLQPSSLSQAGQPALCRAVNTPPSRQASAFVPGLWETFMQWLQGMA